MCSGRHRTSACSEGDELIARWTGDGAIWKRRLRRTFVRTTAVLLPWSRARSTANGQPQRRLPEQSPFRVSLNTNLNSTGNEVRAGGGR
jgi:hypothetical protein